MALKNCRECKKKVSTEALTCPDCGVPNPTKNFSKMKESKFILAERKQNADRAKSVKFGKYILAIPASSLRILISVSNAHLFASTLLMKLFARCGYP